MINVKTVYDTVLDLLSKNNGEFLGIDEFNRLLHQASNELFDDLIGFKNNPRVVYGKNRTTDRRLNGFRVTSNPLVVNKSSKIVTLPADLAYIRTILHDDIAVRPIDEDRVGKLKRDTLANPNEDDKYYLELGGREIKILNSDIDKVEVYYLKRPNKAEYKVKMENIGGRQRPTYDSVNSINLLEWDERELSEIVTRILAKTGLTMRDTFVTQVTNNNKAEE